MINSKMINILFIGVSLLTGSCQLFNDKELDNNYSPDWEYDFEIGYFTSINPVIYKDLVVFSGLDERKTDFSANSTLEAFNKQTGDIQWKWSENVRESYDQFSSSYKNVVYNGQLYISSGWEYSINLENGKTSHSGNNDKINGVNFYSDGNKLFSFYVTEDEKISTLEYSSFNEFNWTEIYSEFNDSTITYLDYALFEKSNESTILIPYSKWNGKVSRPFLLSIDLRNNQVLKDIEIDLNEGSHFIDYLPILENDNLYISANGIISSISKDDGHINWQYETEGNSSRSGLTVDESSVYVNTEFILYSLDKYTGEVNWSIPSYAGSRLVIHQDVLYYIGGSNLIGVNIFNGEKLLDIEAPSYRNDQGAFFQPIITIDHENDKLYTASYTHDYCYPTLR
jgi:hypothetical protein